MKVLLDENLTVDLRHIIPGHDVATVQFMRWKGTKNGALLRLAQDAGFDALVTADQALPYENDMQGMSIRVVILKAPSLQLADLRPLMPQVAQILPLMRPGEVRRLG